MVYSVRYGFIHISYYEQNRCVQIHTVGRLPSLVDRVTDAERIGKKPNEADLSYTACNCTGLSKVFKPERSSGRKRRETREHRNYITPALLRRGFIMAKLRTLHKRAKIFP